MPGVGKPKRTPLWRSLVMFAVCLLAVPLTVIIGAMVSQRIYLPISIAVTILSMVPFFITFERRRPQARELVTLAVMVALAIVSRVAFAFVPNFKPTVGIIMIAAIAFGPSSGFLVGTLTAFVSNFIFGQGPWTPWQMLSFGLSGFAFGLLAERGIIPRDGWTTRTALAVGLGGGLFILCIAGPILDTSSLFWMATVINPESVAAVYLAGIPMNTIHGAAVFATIALGGRPILEMLARLKAKYAILE